MKEEIRNFLDERGWPNPDYNLDVDLVSTLMDFYVYLLTERKSNIIFNERFSDVNLSRNIRADVDGCPLLRKCHEHETLMSFNCDDDNYAFNEWWHEKGAYLFNLWLKIKK